MRRLDASGMKAFAMPREIEDQLTKLFDEKGIVIGERLEGQGIILDLYEVPTQTVLASEPYEDRVESVKRLLVSYEKKLDSEISKAV